MLLDNFPILKLLVPFVFGIFGGYFTPINQNGALLFLSLEFILLIWILLLRQKTSFLNQKVLFGAVMVFYFLAGFLFTFFRFYTTTSLNQTILEDEKVRIAEVIDPIFEREKTMKTIIKTDENKVLIYIQKDSNALKLQPGDLILIQAKFKKIEAPKNPDSFDYQTYMQRKGISLTTYVSNQNWSYYGRNQSFNLTYWAYKIQQRLSKIFRDHGLKGDEYQVAAAILLGNDDTMEPELKAVYSNAGVSHILSVSGMHVGIIFMILNYLLLPLDWNKKTRYLKTGILFFSIWLYSAITGLSPSVIRSATMFSFVLIGAVLKRKTNIFQSLYASLFIILVFNPLLIFDVGFQLSYLAVFGIVIFQKPIGNLVHPKTRIGNYFWSLCSVSLAAQISTFPISIFYFHQFPNYFLLANLFVIFLSFCIMICGTAVLAVSFIPSLCDLLSKILNLLIHWMNGITTAIQELPGALSENLSLSTLQMFLLYVLIIFLMITFRYKNKKTLFASLLTLMLFLILLTFDSYKTFHQSQWMVFSIPKENALLFHDHGNTILLSETMVDQENATYRFSIHNFVTKNRMDPVFLSWNQDTLIGDFYKRGDLILFKNKKILLLTSSTNIASYSRIPFDYVYLVDPKINMVTILNSVHCKKIIWGEKIPIYLEKRWIECCKTNKISYHSTREKRAFHRTLTLNVER
ncbi:MAG TPA: ComEC/Rec2 family competence protein [Bacteroidales bacterium]|nr:ComEC/Rec2 family competence protein [Bacteroidales bacterium]HPS71542.1 ComEC/Rec2 family competence protein [Bacteroidales bacterium]